MLQIRSFVFALLIAVSALAGLSAPVLAQNQSDLRSLINELAKGRYDDTERQIEAIAATGEEAAVPALQALGSNDLMARKSDGAVFIVKKKSGGYQLIDPLTGDVAGEAGRRDMERIKINNRLRRAIQSALGELTLMSKNPDRRRQAAEQVFKARDTEAIETIDAALDAETDPGIATLLREARAAAVLNSDASEADKIAAVGVIKARGDQEARAILAATADSSANSGQTALHDAATRAQSHVEQILAAWNAAQNVWYGLSLGSVLLLAAIGLAITFGVMGVINMAHGEMVMIGAYTTFMVQEVIRNSAPWLFDASLAIALPLAFLIAGAVGVALERFVIRFLYGRPLETLLATWGISLILQQAVRTIFGANNREVGTPSWMSGLTEVGGLTITYNRLAIIIFSLVVFGVLITVLKSTRFGLYTRAVTQNRRMASSMGIRTPWVDAMTFGLGSGIAGIAGVALSQIDNVSPNLGQSYIIDSFMVVVFGGVGNLWGTLVGAMTLGVVNKFLEPYAGAVLAKILLLVFIILFIQKRPRGLFALKGRAVEA
ncbi:amino acid/amide ABC transporter membrane protein 1 (HAAT family) [Breoghania corrubedonensis]|uniref:Amino acid/amide ABC transporter membrane protein 1 (HAAT family) n=1 Tax=Breoghania corrubedonensis TaxID=665038 RepID=A0A2T5V5Q3_9HYPH|nr:urea ABC transporter permease subunit UrtB [Breoghania corrubedonensis]PTW59071.1 amino acid/amide ABC transporter membrane protein 1 (HAAT family) [Breoghania corrubedonensis]